MKKIIDGKLIDTERISIEELEELKKKLKLQEKELLLKIRKILKEINSNI